MKMKRPRLRGRFLFRSLLEPEWCKSYFTDRNPRGGVMMANAAQSGTFLIGGKAQVHRLGFGAMRVTGRGIWGPPADKAQALSTLRRVPELGVNFIDTADAYGPEVSENLIREALHPYDGLVIATKGGLTRSGPDRWSPNGNPHHLIEAAKKSRERLKVSTIALWQLHQIDPKVPRGEQFAAVKSLLDQGIIARAGLSNVSVSDIEAARKVFPVATVQNHYNLVTRNSEDALDYCAQHGIGFIPWYPLAAGNLARPGSLLDQVAKMHHATAAQIALAWTLKRSPVMLPIPGTGKVKHLEENVAAAEIALSDQEFSDLDRESQVKEPKRR
jgi:pyridoxine 4-dehydrogenase